VDELQDSSANLDQRRTLPAYVLITPARNEARYIESTLRSVISQTVAPLKWVIVSDGSTDGTDALVDRYRASHPWIELLRLTDREERNFAGKVAAFNAGRRLVESLPYEVICNLDADVSFEPTHFEFLLEKFARNPRLGVAGTAFIEDGDVAYNYRYTNIHHVSGQCQLFRRSCFDQIGGYKPIKGGGIDWAAVTTARMQGWETRTFAERAFTHHRTMGTETTGVLAARFRFGKQDYYLGSDPLWEVFRAVYQMKNKPYLFSGIALYSGYLWGYLTRAPRPIPRELLEFRRREQKQRLLKIFRQVLHA
jgi:glycosyltransferase involved in cell wall biosynthesis